MKRSIQVIAMVLFVAGVSGIALAETSESVCSKKFVGRSLSIPPCRSVTQEHSNVQRSGSANGLGAIGDLLMSVGLVAMVVGALLMFSSKLFMRKAVAPVGGLGKIVSSQLSLMQMAGLAIARLACVENPTVEQVEASKLDGYKKLKMMTGRDFGRDVEDWFEFLTTHAGKYKFTYPEGYAIMRNFLEECGYNLPWNEDIEMAS